MAISKITQTIQDGALGLTAGSGLDQHIKVGVASSGTANVLKWHTDPQAVKTEFGTGPVVDAAVYHLETAGGTVGVMRITSSVAGAAGSVTTTRGGGGTSTGTMAVTGTPLDGYAVIAKFTRGATNLAANLASFVYSLDGGDTWSDETALPTNGVYAIPNTGLTMTWTDGETGTSYAVDDTFSFDCVAPGYSATNVGDALDAIRANATAKFRFIHLVGAASSGSGSATIAATVATKMAAEETNYRYTYCWLEAADDTDGNLITAFASFVSARVNVVAGYCELSANGRIMKRSAAWPAAARRMQQTPQRDLARTAPDTQGGALVGITKLYRDEYLTPGLDAARFTTLRTYPGQPGFYVGNGRLMYGPGSDFQKLQYRELMDVACATNYEAMFPYIGSDDLVVDEETGFIDEVSARAIEAKVNGRHKAVLRDTNWVSAVRTTIARDNNILSTSTLKTRVRITPKGYASDIESEIGFYNPALAAA